jgi:hypothetical protein
VASQLPLYYHKITFGKFLASKLPICCYEIRVWKFLASELLLSYDRAPFCRSDIAIPLYYWPNYLQEISGITVFALLRPFFYHEDCTLGEYRNGSIMPLSSYYFLCV